MILATQEENTEKSSLMMSAGLIYKDPKNPQKKSRNDLPTIFFTSFDR